MITNLLVLTSYKLILQKIAKNKNNVNSIVWGVCPINDVSQIREKHIYFLVVRKGNEKSDFP